MTWLFKIVIQIGSTDVAQMLTRVDCNLNTMYSSKKQDNIENGKKEDFKSYEETEPIYEQNDI